MRRLLLRVCGIAIAGCLVGVPVRADGPVAGFNLGAAVPLSKYRKTVDKDVGGTFGLSGGYRFDLSDHLAVSLLANPQFTFLPTEPGCCRGKNDHEVGSTFSITSGPRFSLLTGIVETYVGAQGGYYRDMSGPMSDDGAGFNAGGGLNFELGNGASLGLFGRYDYAKMVARPGSDVDRQWALGRHRLPAGVRARGAGGRGSAAASASASAATPAAAGAPPDRAPRRQLRFRSREHSPGRAPDPRRGDPHAPGRVRHPHLGRGPHRRDRYPTRTTSGSRSGVPPRSPTTWRAAASRAGG